MKQYKYPFSIITIFYNEMGIFYSIPNSKNDVSSDEYPSHQQSADRS